MGSRQWSVIERRRLARWLGSWRRKKRCLAPAWSRNNWSKRRDGFASKFEFAKRMRALPAGAGGNQLARLASLDCCCTSLHGARMRRAQLFLSPTNADLLGPTDARALFLRLVGPFKVRATSCMPRKQAITSNLPLSNRLLASPTPLGPHPDCHWPVEPMSS